MSRSIVSARKRFSLIFYAFPLFFNIFVLKILKLWRIEKCEKYFFFNVKIWKSWIFWRNLRYIFCLKISKKNQNLKIWKISKILKKSQNSSTVFFFFFFVSVRFFFFFFFVPSWKIFFGKISRKICFDHSLVSKMDFCITLLVYNVALRSHCSYYWDHLLSL